MRVLAHSMAPDAPPGGVRLSTSHSSRTRGAAAKAPASGGAADTASLGGCRFKASSAVDKDSALLELYTLHGIWSRAGPLLGWRDAVSDMRLRLVSRVCTALAHGDVVKTTSDLLSELGNCVGTELYPIT